MSQKEVKLHYRDLKIAYEVDQKSIADLAAHYEIEWADMKKALRDYGFTIRLKEVKPENPPKAYKVILVDSDKIVVEEPKVTTAQ